MSMSVPDTRCPVVRTSRADATAAKKRHLLQVARDQFVRHGYRAVTMDAIAQAAGVSKRSLYLWHADKAALFRACVIEGAERFPLPDVGSDLDIGTSLRLFGLALVQEFARPSTLGIGMLLIREAQEFTDILPLIERSRQQYLVQPLARHLAQAGSAGGDARRAADLLLAMLLAPIHNHLLMGTPLPRDVEIGPHVALAVDTFLAGWREAEAAQPEP